MLTKATLAGLLTSALADPGPFLSRVFYITTKGLPGQQPVMLLDPNRAQQRILDAVARRRAEGRPPRIICLKARQPGISTMCEALITLTAMACPYTTSMILTDLDESSEKLFDKCKFALDRMPEELKPVEFRRKANMMSFSHYDCQDGDLPIESQIHVSTASGREVWRGMTLRAIHLSEFAKFPYPGATLDGVMQSVPKTTDSLVVIESTARGEGNLFHEEWKRAERGESEFLPVFIPWFDLPDCYMTPAADFRPTAKEEDLARKHRLSIEQLAWYRFTLETECRGDPDTFNQEYPDTPDVAFLTSGNPAFPMKPLREMAERAREVQGRRGEILEINEQPVFADSDDGRLVIYHPPVAGHDYTIGGDAAAGVEGGDYLSAQVLDRMTLDQVATWHGYIPPMEFGKVMVLLGYYYNTAILAPELTGGHGATVVEQTKHSFYPRLYVFRRVDKIKDTVTTYIGWETSPRTRGLLFDTMHWFISYAQIMLWDLGTIQEFREMRYVDPNRAEGLHHDDRAMAMMIALRAHYEMPMLDTGLPPKLVLPTEKTVEPVETVPPLPDQAIGRVAWLDTDQAVRQMGGERRKMLDEYGNMPDGGGEDGWDPGGDSWVPEMPW